MWSHKALQVIVSRSILISFAAILSIHSSSHAQSFELRLSPKHTALVNKYKPGHDRLKKYYKFYKQDSSRTMRKLSKQYRQTIDSAYRAERMQARLAKRLARKGSPIPTTKMRQFDTLSYQLKMWDQVLKDSLTSDSLRQVAKEKVKELIVAKAKQYPGFEHIMEKYHTYGDTASWQTISNQIPGIDSLAGLFDSDPEKIFAIAEKQASERFEKLAGMSAVTKEFAEAEKLKNLREQYKTEYQQYLTKEQWKSQAKEKAIEEASDFISQNGDKLQSAQMKLGRLLDKYRTFNNSSDLSNSVKRTSMQGRTFFEHLVLGGYFNVVSTDPVSIDISPQLGYKFTTKLFAGVGMNYRLTFSDTIKNSYYVSPHNTSFKAFTSYDIIKSFYGYAEWEKSGMPFKENDETKTIWKDNYFVGVGRRILIHPKLYMTITATYNLNGEESNPIHPHRFQVRVGFQTSELATRKKTVSYHPNR